MAEKGKMKAISIPLEFVIPDDLATKVATNMIVQHSEHEFFIYFFEAQPPLILGETEADLKKMKKIRAKCVAKVIVAADRMEEFVDVWNKNFSGYISQWQENNKNKKDNKKNVRK